MRVVATAGHVDHGKSTLVLALTGTDPDRLEQEKERGLTIDLGFAFTTLHGQQVGFVDVPGHVRFVKNMLAGVGAVEVAVLVVAATEGWMPQSEEHLRILELLGVSYGVVAITKVDLVDTETLEIAQLEVSDHLAGTAAASWPVVAVDGVSGHGVEALADALGAVLARAPIAEDRGRPRLWVDRVFSARGAGTIVTGTLGGGPITVDDDVIVEPGGRAARVRTIESGHERHERVCPGARVALNLAGIEHSDIRRGDAVVHARQWARPTIVDVSLLEVPGQRLDRRARLHAHVGSGEQEVAFRSLDEAHGYARLRLSRSAPLAPGDRIVLRSSARRATVAGAIVLDVDPALRTREACERLALPLPERVLAHRIAVRVADLVPLAGLDMAGAQQMADELVASGRAQRFGETLVAQASIDQLAAEARTRVESFHRERPLEPGIALADLASGLGVEVALLRAVIDAVGDLAVERDLVRDPAHAGSPDDDAAVRDWLDAIRAEPFSPPSPSEFGVDAGAVRALQRTGRVDEVDGLWFTTEALGQIRRLVARAVVDRGALTIADLRDLLDSTRKFVVPIANYTDRCGITRRRGDERLPGPRAVQDDDADP